MVVDRLWPVLLALIALVGGALLLEEYARRRGNEAIVVAIDETAAAPAAAGEEGDEEEPGPGSGEPLNDAHARARVAAQRGELNAALALFAQVVKENPAAAPVRDEYGYWLLSARRTREALDELEAAKRLSPGDPGVALHLGLARVRLDDPAGAEAELRRALQLRAGFGAAQRSLGRLLRKRKHYDEAITLLTDASSSGGNEERARSLVELGTAQLAAGKRPEADASFARAIEFAPARVEIRLAAARAFLSSPDKALQARALDAIHRAAELAPDLPQVHVLLGRALERTGERGAAEAAYEQALRLDPGSRVSRRRLLRMALDKKDFARARGQAAQLLAEAPEEPEHHFLAALVADRDGREEEARALYRAALARAKGDYPEAWFNLGLMEKRAGNLDAAGAAYQAALKLRPGYLAALNNLSLVRLAVGDAPGAERALREALRVDPTYAAAWLNLGELLSKQERYPEAIEALQKALAARPGYAQARLNLGVAWARAGQPEQAITTYQQLVAEQPRYLSGWYNLAVVCQAQGRAEQTREALARALEIDPDHAASLRMLAELDQASGKTEAALSDWRDLLDRDPNDRGARLALAELLQQTGDLGGCTRTVQPLLARTPKDQVALELLSRCAPPGGAAQP